MGCHLVVSFCFICGLNADILSTFDTNLDGWTMPNQQDSMFDWQSAGGNPGGFAQFVDGDADNSTFITAPANFLGDWSGFDSIGSISFDHQQIDAGTGNTLVPFEIFLSGPGGSARFTEDHPGTIGPWLSVNAKLIESLWSVENGSWSGLLADVTQFDIRIEVVDNNNTLGDHAGIDNIAVRSVPEPCGFCIILFGVSIAAISRRNKL